MKNLGNMLKQAQQMQSRMQEMQAKLEATEVDCARALGDVGGQVHHQLLALGGGEVGQRKADLAPRGVDAGDGPPVDFDEAHALGQSEAQVDRAGHHGAGACLGLYL